MRLTGRTLTMAAAIGMALMGATPVSALTRADTEALALSSQFYIAEMGHLAGLLASCDDRTAPLRLRPEMTAFVRRFLTPDSVALAGLKFDGAARRSFGPCHDDLPRWTAKSRDATRTLRREIEMILDRNDM